MRSNAGDCPPAGKMPAGRIGFSSVACRSDRKAVQRGSGRSVARSSSTSRLNSGMPSFLIRNFRRALARLVALAEAREHAADRLRHRQQLAFGQEFVEQQRRLRHRAEAAAHVVLEAAHGLAVDGAGAGDAAHVVEVRQPARVVLAAREGDLELAAKVLGVVVAQQEEGDGVGVRHDVERFRLADARRRGTPSRCARCCRTPHGW